MTGLFRAALCLIAGILAQSSAGIPGGSGRDREVLERAICVDPATPRCDAQFSVERWMLPDLPGEVRRELEGDYEMLGIMGPSARLHIFPGGRFVRVSHGCTGSDVAVGIVRGRGDHLELRSWRWFSEYDLLAVRWYAGHPVLLRENELDAFDAHPSLLGGQLVRLRPGERRDDFE